MSRRPPQDHPARKQVADDRDALLDVRAAAALLSVQPATLYRWAYERRLPVVKLFGPRGPLRFRRRDLLDLIERSHRPALRPGLPLDGA